jgi:hypothetical protein
MVKILVDEEIVPGTVNLVEGMEAEFDIVISKILFF